MVNRQSGIGILGLGSRSTLFYIEQLNYKYQLIHGGYSTCPFTLLNTNFNTLNPFLPNDFEALQKNLLPYLEAIENLNIEALLIPNITLHETVDLIMPQQDFKFSIINPLTSTLDLLNENAQNEVVLFATLHSMKASYLTSHLQKNNIKVLLPSETEMKFIDDLRQNIYNNEESAIEIIQYQQLVNSYAANKAVVIACTELSLVATKINPHVYDMAHIQIDKALNILNSE